MKKLSLHKRILSNGKIILSGELYCLREKGVCRTWLYYFSNRFLILIFLLMIPLSGIGQKNIPSIKKNHTKDVYNIDVYTAYQAKQPLLISQIADDIEFIPLETTVESLLDNNLRDITITEKDIFLFDYNKGYRFDRRGKFLNSIGSKGQGPDEFVRPMRMAVDTINRWIYFYDYTRNIVKYDYNGKHIETFATGGYGFGLLLINAPAQFVIDNGNYLFSKPGERYSMCFYSEKEKKVISKFSCDYKEKIPSMSICDPIAYKNNDNLFLKDFWCDTIYMMKGAYDAYSYAVVHKGKFINRNVDDLSLIGKKPSSEERLILGVYQIHESDRFVYLSTNKGAVIFDKKENKTFLDEYVENKIKITDDLYGGIINNSIKTIYKNKAITYCHSHELITTDKHLINDERYRSYKTMVEKRDPDDNPVLIVIKLKQ